MKSLKKNVFFHLSLEVAEILSAGLLDQFNSFFVDRFFISSVVDELFVLNHENSYVMSN